MSTVADPKIAPEPPDAVADADAPRQGLGLALAIIGGAQLMIVLDGTIVNIALPHIQTDLGFSQASLSWVVNAYALSLGSLLLLGGRLGDLLGRRKMLVLGVLLFAAASLVGGLALNPAMLISSRIVQGLGAAIASPAALALITTTFPAGKERNRAMGVYAAMSGAGAAVGLILGGALTEYDWRWTFFINVPIGLLVAFLAPRVLVESEAGQGSLDLGGALTGTAGLVGIVYGLTHAAEPTGGWGSSLTIACLVAGVAFLTAFVVIERRNPFALLPIRILTDRTRGTSLFVMLLVGAGMFAMFYFLGLYIQQVLGYSPIRTGLAFLPMSVSMGVMSAGITARLVNRFGNKQVLIPGMVSASAGLALVAMAGPHAGYFSDIFPGFLLIGLGAGSSFMPLLSIAMSEVPNGDAGLGSGIVNVSMQMAAAIGLAILGTVATEHTRTLVIQGQSVPEALTHGYQLAFRIAAICVGVGPVVAAVLLEASPDRIGVADEDHPGLNIIGDPTP